MMEFSTIHLTYPKALLIGLVVPVVWILYFYFNSSNKTLTQLEKFVDKHLMPYLLVTSSFKSSRKLLALLLWSFVWLLMTVALAGPRWNMQEIESYSKDQSLVILLDLSESMNGTDVLPSRLILAKQKIEDLIRASEGVRIGLVAFAADAHMITPITDDTETLKVMLPPLETDLVHVQGSRLSPALEMANLMLKNEPGSNKAILVISDGGFEDAGAIIKAKELSNKGLVIYTVGVGTETGSPLKDKLGNTVKKDGTVIVSKLDKERLHEISLAGNGRYFEGNHSNLAEVTILNELKNLADQQVQNGKKQTLWQESFYLFLIPVVPMFLWWFKRGAILAVLAIGLFFQLPLPAQEVEDYFKNSEQQGLDAFNRLEYDSASTLFQDSYRKGVACYKDGRFAEAEQYFNEVTREPVVLQALYNAGNCLVQQQKFKEACRKYKEVLKQDPNHVKAKENLELVKKWMQEQKDQSSSDNDENKSDEQEEKSSSDSTSEANKEKSDQNSQENDSNEDSDDYKNDDTPEEQNTPEDKEDTEEPPCEQLDENDQKPPQNEEASVKAEPADQNQSEAERNADLWLNQIENDPKQFLKNKFYLESKKNRTTKGIDPW